MHARLAMLSVGPGNRSRVEEFADRLAGVYKAQKGFKSLCFLAHESGNDWGSFVLWETADEADAAGKAGVSFLQENLGDILNGPPIVQVFEVYEPKA